jgi:hypothetical protein
VCQVDRSVFEQAEVPDAEGLSWVRAVADLDLLSASDGYAQLLTIWRNGPLDRRLVVELDAGCFVDVRGCGCCSRSVGWCGTRAAPWSCCRRRGPFARVLAILDPAAELPFSRSTADAQMEARQCPLTSTP